MEESVSDSELVVRTRAGDTSAYGELWSRHYAAGIRMARAVTSVSDPEDLVQESFTKVFQAIRNGDGPRGAAFRSYLFTTIRNAAVSSARASKEVSADVFEETPDPSTSDAASARSTDREFAARAFYLLPARWQEVLWYTEVERMKPQDVAQILGMSSLSVRQLSFRAREGLKDAWVRAHLHSDAEEGTECRWSIDRLGSSARNRLGPRGSARLEAHLAQCQDCTRVAQEAADVVKNLPLAVLPLVIGMPGAVAYLSSAIDDSPTAVAAWTALPDGVHGAAHRTSDSPRESADSTSHGKPHGAGRTTTRDPESPTIPPSPPKRLLAPSLAAAAVAAVMVVSALIPTFLRTTPTQPATAAWAGVSADDTAREPSSPEEESIADAVENAVPEAGETPGRSPDESSETDRESRVPPTLTTAAVPPAPSLSDTPARTPTGPPQVEATRVRIGKYSASMPTADANGVVVEVQYAITGTVEATVRSLINGKPIGETTLGAGPTYVWLALTKAQYCGEVPVSFAYVEENQLGDPTTVTAPTSTVTYCSS